MNRRAAAAFALCLLPCGCSYAELGPKNPSLECRAGAPPPKSASSPGFPCWPPGLTPEECPVHVENQIVVAASPEVTWAWLTRADLWSSYFPRAKDVHFESGGPELQVGTVVVWEMLGATIRVTVTRADAPSMLVWEGGAKGVHAYHAWLLVPEQGGTRVVTVETESGPIPSFFGGFFEGSLHDAHDEWLRGLAKVAPTGPPPARR